MFQAVLLVSPTTVAGGRSPASTRAASKPGQESREAAIKNTMPTVAAITKRGTHVRQLPSLNKMQRAYEAKGRHGSRASQTRWVRSARTAGSSDELQGTFETQQTWHDDQEDRDQEVTAERRPVGPSADPADVEDASGHRW